MNVRQHLGWEKISGHQKIRCFSFQKSIKDRELVPSRHKLVHSIALFLVRKKDLFRNSSIQIYYCPSLTNSPTWFLGRKYVAKVSTRLWFHELRQRFYCILHRLSAITQKKGTPETPILKDHLAYKLLENIFQNMQTNFKAVIVAKNDFKSFLGVNRKCSKNQALNFKFATDCFNRDISGRLISEKTLK